MIQTGIKLKVVADFIKEYLSVIIILPAILGGLWQLIELWSIAPSFIRFFSISQIVPDGLFILFLLAYCCIPFLVTHFLHTVTHFSGKTTLELIRIPIIKDEKMKLKVYSLSFFLLCFFGTIFFFYFSFIDDKFVQADSGIMLAMWIIALCNLSLNICYDTANDQSKYHYKMCNFFLFLLYITIAIFIFKKVHKNQLPVVSIVNIEYVKSLTDKNYPDSKNEILYFNDKFIFFKIKDKNKIDYKTQKHTERIIIVKLDDVFDK